MLKQSLGSLHASILGQGPVFNPPGINTDVIYTLRCHFKSCRFQELIHVFETIPLSFSLIRYRYTYRSKIIPTGYNWKIRMNWLLDILKSWSCMQSYRATESFIQVGALNLNKSINRYCQVSDIKRTLIDNTIVYHSDVVDLLPAAAAPTTSSFST